MDSNDYRHQQPRKTMLIFGIPVSTQYSVELGVLFAITFTVICVSFAYRARISIKKSKRRKILKATSTSIKSDNGDASRAVISTDDRCPRPPPTSEFHENGGSVSDLGQVWNGVNGIVSHPAEATVPLNWEQLSEQRMLQKSKEFYEFMNSRRSVRSFSQEKMPRKIIENLILTAGTSPSGANQQPWRFVLVEDPETKATIRQIVEYNEEINYRKRMGARWVEALRHLNVNWIKPYLTEAPYLLFVFKQTHSEDEAGDQQINYYSEFGAPIAVGILLAAIHNAGLVTVVSTPLNCGRQLSKLLKRPDYERLLFLLPIGYPAIDCSVPAIKRKPLEKIYVHH